VQTRLIRGHCGDFLYLQAIADRCFLHSREFAANSSPTLDTQACIPFKGIVSEWAHCCNP